MANNHETCLFSKFDELWGEFKCLLFKKRIYDHNTCTSCKSYKKRPEDNNKKE